MPNTHIGTSVAIRCAKVALTRRTGKQTFKNIDLRFRLPCGAQTVKQTWSAKL